MWHLTEKYDDSDGPNIFQVPPDRRADDCPYLAGDWSWLVKYARQASHLPPTHKKKLGDPKNVSVVIEDRMLLIL